MPTREFFLALGLLFLNQGSNGVDGSPETSPVGMMRRPLQTLATSWSFSRRKRDEEPPSYLKWVTFEGKLPTDAVSNWNNYTQKMEYVCSTQVLGCNPGAYIPERGPFCFFPYGEWERRTEDFKILINVGDFEALDWVDNSFGNVPKNAVQGCPAVDVFIGRNRYGLGKISKEQRAAFMMVDGEEVWYKWYQVLVVKKGPADITISNVHYNMSRVVEHWENVTLMKTTVRNEGCQEVWKTITLEEVTEMEHNWVVDQRVFTTVRGVLRAALLTFNGTGWELTNITDVSWVGGASTSEYIVHTHVVEKEVQPWMVCAVALEGRRLDGRVPFTAQLTRDFEDGQTHRVAVTGWAHSRAVVGVRAGVKECWPIPDVSPCWGW